MKYLDAFKMPKATTIMAKNISYPLNGMIEISKN